MKPIYLYGSDILRKKCTSITLITSETQDLLFDLQSIADEMKAIGLSANQLGYTKRAFIIRSSTHSKIFINPEIIWTSNDTEIMHEGCLSIPLSGRMMPDIARYRAIKVKYQDANLVHHESAYEDAPAMIIQHEIDHLDGVLMIDLATPGWKKKFKRHLRDIKQGLIIPRYDSVITQKGKVVHKFESNPLDI